MKFYGSHSAARKKKVLHNYVFIPFDIVGQRMS